MSSRRHTISLSKHLDVTRKVLEKAGVFDATLGIDTKLFIDPKLLVSSRIPEFKNSRIKILAYFRKLIRIHKMSAKAEQLRVMAHGMLAVPEPPGLAIGYGNTTDRGMAISSAVADRILATMSEVLTVGIEDEELVELMALFVKGFASDSISDLSAHIIYDDLCKYTHKKAKLLRVKTKSYTVNGKTYKLPPHPFKNHHIIFVPHKLLSPLPVATDWDEIAAAAMHNRELRRTFSDIVKPVISEALSDIKSQPPDVIKQVQSGLEKLVNVYQRIRVGSYNLKTDDRGYYGIQPFVDRVANDYSAPEQPKTLEELVSSVREFIKRYARSIEATGGNNILYHRTKHNRILKNKPHHEDVAQTLFFMLADLWCSTANIMLAREPKSGPGAVDFSLGTGYQTKVLVEIKKSHNNDLEHGYKKQIAAYEKAEAAQHSFFVVIVIRESKKRRDEYPPQLVSIMNLYEENKKKGIKTPELVIIDGLIHPSASIKT